MSTLAVAIQGEVPTERLRHTIYAYPPSTGAIDDELRTLR